MLLGTDLAEDLMLVNIDIFDTILWSRSSEERGREERADRLPTFEFFSREWRLSERP
jgi:hypothetical protein